MIMAYRFDNAGVSRKLSAIDIEGWLKNFKTEALLTP